jgi:anti-sigma-K factor RskA
MVASPTVPSDTAAESESVNTSTDDGVSGWRIAQITMSVTLLLLAVAVVALTRLRRQQTVGMKLGTYFGQATFTKYS